MIKATAGLVLLVFVITGLTYSKVAAAPLRHRDFQAVQADGSPAYTWQDSTWVVLEGIVLNNPEEMLDPRPDYSNGWPPAEPMNLGGQWQMFIQADDPCDFGGTALWMGQNYSMIKQDPCASYGDGDWVAELERLNRDPNTGYVFGPGDKVRVTGKFLFYRGKNNINEQHSSDPANNFRVELIEPGVGLPRPEVLTLADLKHPDDTFIFDATRQSGGEHYQGQLVRINNVMFVDRDTWGPGAAMTITDGTLTFPVRLGIGTGIRPGTCNLAQRFDIVGIMDQEGGFAPPYTGGYRIFVVNYDGNGLVLWDRGYRRGNLEGDVSGDGRVDLADLALLAGDWLQCTAGLGDCGY